jgi:hypothetical protein
MGYLCAISAPGEVGQFDWSYEQAEIAGVHQPLRVAHFRLAHSRAMFVVAYLRETQEMVFDAHNRAFAFFGGVPQRMVYDNLKTVVQTILSGKERRFNSRFMALASHYLFEPVACTPASGWEKGQVENQVGNIREWLFTPKLRFASLTELNDWLALRCRELTSRRHPLQHRPIAEVFAEEQAALRHIVAPFDGYVEDMLRVSSHLPDPGGLQPLQRTVGVGRQGGLRASDGRSGAGGPREQDHRHPPASLRAGATGLRPLALSAGTGEEAGGTASWRPLRRVGASPGHPDSAGSPAEAAQG